MVHLSDGELAIVIVLSFLWAVIGYRLSENDRRTLGRTPWGLPSMVWALFWFLSLVLGLVLYLIAHTNGVRRAQHGSAYPGAGGRPVPGAGGGRPAPGSGVWTRTPSVAEQFPAYPQPANVQPELSAEDPAGRPEQTGPVPADGGQVRTGQVPADRDHGQGAAPSPPAWHPDPSGRFHFRWWDGHQWTSQVSIDGHHLIDTNPDQRIGPY